MTSLSVFGIEAGLPDGLFSNRPIFGKIWWALEWKMLLYF
jgi:hypothetical protein